MLLRSKNIGLLAAMTLCIVSCGSEQAPERSVTKTEEKEQIVDSRESYKDKEEPPKWYSGELPTNEEKKKLLLDFQSGNKNFDFYAVFTEPFWTFYFFGNEALIITMDAEVPDVVPLEYPFSENEDAQALSFMLNGEFWQFQVTKETGSDGMSEIEYPYTVKLDLLEGGGATKLMRGN